MSRQDDTGSPYGASRMTLSGATIIDGTGRPPFRGDIEIEGERIVSVKPAAEGGCSQKQSAGSASKPAVRRDSEGRAARHDVFDFAGYTVLPGFIDCHVHLVAPADGRQHEPYWNFQSSPCVKLMNAVFNAYQTLRAGFTTVRNCGGASWGMPEDIALRDAIRSGLVLGPRILACGQGITMTGGHGDRGTPAYLYPNPLVGFGAVTADGPLEVRREVRNRIKMGADFVKIYSTGGVSTPGDGPHSVNFSLEETRAAVEEAHLHGKRVATHAQGLVGIRTAVEAGVDTVEHGSFLDGKTAELMASSGISLISTVSVFRAIMERASRYPVQGAPEKAAVVYDAQIRAVSLAKSLGVNVALGTDASVSIRNGDNALEIVALVEEVGFTPMEAIQCATKNSAAALGLDTQLGTLEPGKIADIVVVTGNPLDDIRVLVKKDAVKAVVALGRPVFVRTSGGGEVFGQAVPLEVGFRKLVRAFD